MDGLGCGVGVRVIGLGGVVWYTRRCGQNRPAARFRASELRLQPRSVRKNFLNPVYSSSESVNCSV